LRIGGLAGDPRGRQISGVAPLPSHPLPPYALAAPVFPFPHLAALAGRAPIGGAREVALACFVAARLAADRTLDGDAIAPPGRAERSTGAKAWLGTLTIPAAVRAPLARCVDASASAAPPAVGREVVALASAAAPYLDPGSRAELDALASALDTAV
jgi:hypothetical protein